MCTCITWEFNLRHKNEYYITGSALLLMVNINCVSFVRFPDVLSFDSLSVSLKTPQKKIVFETTVDIIFNAEISNYAEFNIDDSDVGRTLLYLRVSDLRLNGLFSYIPNSFRE